MKSLTSILFFSVLAFASDPSKVAEFTDDVEIELNPRATAVGKTLLVMAQSNGDIWLINLETGKKELLIVPKTRNGWVEPIIALSPSEKYIAVSVREDGFDDSFLYRFKQTPSGEWEVKNVHCDNKGVSRYFTTAVSSMVFGIYKKGNEYLVTNGSCSGTDNYQTFPHAYDMKSGEYRFDFGLLGTRPNHFAMSSNHRYLLASYVRDQDPIQLWDFNSKKRVVSIPVESKNTLLLESQQLVIAARHSGEISIVKMSQDFRGRHKRPVIVLPKIGFGRIADMKASSDGSLLAVAYRTLFTGEGKIQKSSPGGAAVWNLKTGKLVWKLEKNEKEQVMAARFEGIKDEPLVKNLPVFYGYNDWTGVALKWTVKEN